MNRKIVTRIVNQIMSNPLDLHFLAPGQESEQQGKHDQAEQEQQEQIRQPNGRIHDGPCGRRSENQRETLHTFSFVFAVVDEKSNSRADEA
jgi:hypothetical protein